MISYKYSEDIKYNIEKLKKNLMTTDNIGNDTDKTVSSARQLFNEEAGKIFEDNIRHTLEYNYDFEKMKYQNTIFIKRIVYNKEEIEIIQNDDTELKIMGKIYKFLFDNKYVLSIKNEKEELLAKIKSEFANKQTEIIINEIKFIVYPYKEAEFDGFFKMNKFSVNLFNENEISIMYSNVGKEEEKNFIYSMIEVKLNPKKINDLIRQIKRDNRLLKIMNYNSAVILGFLNSGDEKYKSNFNTLKKLKCVIYGIKNSTLCGKKVSQVIDWDLEMKFKKLNDTVDTVNKINNKLNDTFNTLNNINNILGVLVPKVNEIYNCFGLKEKEDEKKGKPILKREEIEEMAKDEVKEKKNEADVKKMEEEERKEIKKKKEGKFLKKKKKRPTSRKKEDN